jgi:hypothetical protein
VSGDTVVAVRMREADDVAVLLSAVRKGQSVRVAGKGADLIVPAIESILQHHKIALKTITKGSEVVRNGTVIGRATEKIRSGQCVHIHNLTSQWVSKGKHGG